MPGAQTGHIFISYSRKDDVVMRRVVKHLRGQGFKVWVDNEKLVPGTPIWESEIEEAIINAGAIVVLLSPDSKISEWVRREISYAEDHRKRIFPILVAGDERNSIPIRLTNHQRIDIRENERSGLILLTTTVASHLEYLARTEQERKAEQLKQEQKLAEIAAREAKEKADAERKAREKAERAKKKQAHSEQVKKDRIETDRRAVEKQSAEEKEEFVKKYREQIALQKANEERIKDAPKQGAGEIVRGEETDPPFWQQLDFSWENTAKAIRIFTSILLMVEFIVLPIFGWSSSVLDAERPPWFVTLLQMFLAIGVSFFFGFVEIDDTSSTQQTTGKSKTDDPLWFQIACHAWGVIGFLIWGFITFIGFVLLHLKFFPLSSEATLSGLLAFVWIGLAIAVGIERFGPWTNGARNALDEFLLE